MATNATTMMRILGLCTLWLPLLDGFLLQLPGGSHQKMKSNISPANKAFTATASSDHNDAVEKVKRHVVVVDAVGPGIMLLQDLATHHPEHPVHLVRTLASTDPFHAKAALDIASLGVQYHVTDVVDKHSAGVGAQVQKVIEELKKEMGDDGSTIAGVTASIQGGIRLSEALGRALTEQSLTGGDNIANPYSQGYEDGSANRVCKYAMHTALKRAGLPHAKSEKFDETDSVGAEGWARKYFAANPQGKLVIKPRSGSGSIGVVQCKSSEEVRMAFENLKLNDQDMCQEWNGYPTRELLVQEWLEGDGYKFMCVSGGPGRYVVLSGYRVSFITKSSSIVHDKLDVIPYIDLPQCVREYLPQALDTLGMHYGGSQLEVVVTRGDNPDLSSSEEQSVLVEVNGRIPGSNLALWMGLACEGRFQTEVAADILCGVEPQELGDQLSYEYGPRPQRPHFSLVYLNNNNNIGELKTSLDTSLTKLLVGLGFEIVPFDRKALTKHFIDDKTSSRPLACICAKAKAGTEIGITINQNDALGYVALAADNEMLVKKAYQEIRELEETSLYDVLP